MFYWLSLSREYLTDHYYHLLIHTIFPQIPLSKKYLLLYHELKSRKKKYN
jgi:hypothetical protein